MLYDTQTASSLISAREVLQVLTSLTATHSIVDAGCGNGAWLSAALDLGVDDVLGIDCGMFRPNLLIPESSFHECNLSARNPVIDRKFDMAISLEVADRFPERRNAKFVQLLCSLSDVVLFSSAIPGQREPHSNEHWPSHWAALFDQCGFIALDFLRDMLWKNDRVQWWYRQNMLLFVSPAARQKFKFRDADLSNLDRVHPVFFNLFLDRKLQGLKTVLESSLCCKSNSVKS